MNFLILSRMPALHSTQRLVQEINAGGHSVSVENPESPCEGLFVDVLIPRLGHFRYEQALENLQQLQIKLKPPVILNNALSYRNSRHKKSALIRLQHLPQPKLYENAEIFPLVVKDCLSSQGEGVFLCHTPEELSRCLVKLQGRPVLFQEFIAESRGRDVRVFIVGQKVVAAMERISKDPEREFRSNLSLGGIGRPTVLNAEETQICLEAVKCLELQYAGVDLIRSARGPLILEINPCPGLEGIEKWSQRNITKDLVLHAESLHHTYTSR